MHAVLSMYTTPEGEELSITHPAMASRHMNPSSEVLILYGTHGIWQDVKLSHIICLMPL